MAAPADAFAHRQRVLKRWSSAAIEVGKVDDALLLAEDAPSSVSQLGAQAAASLEIARRGDRARASSVVRSLLEAIRARPFDASSASTMAKAIAVFSRIDEPASADDLEH